MIRVAVPLLHSRWLSDILTAVDGLSRVQGAFAVDLIGLEKRPFRYGAATVEPDRTLRTRRRYDLIVVPSIGFDVQVGLSKNAAFAPWVAAHHARGLDVASWCTGAFLLAEAGVLDGRAATTHWALGAELKRRYPSVNVQPKRMLIDEGSVITAGGATSAYLLFAHLVARYCSAKHALNMAREYVMDLNRPTQEAYADQRRFDQHSDPVVRAAQKYIAGHLRDPLTLEVLARVSNTSPKTLSRRFKATIGLAPITFVQHARVDAAKEALIRSDASFEEITEGVGYFDARAFRRLFKRMTNLSPKGYRRRFRPS